MVFDFFMIKVVQHNLNGVDSVYKADKFSIEEIVDTLLSDKFEDNSQLLIPDPRNKSPSNPINYNMPLVRNGCRMKEVLNAMYFDFEFEDVDNNINESRVTHGLCWEDSYHDMHFINWYSIVRANQRLRVSKASNSLARELAEVLYDNYGAEVYNQSLLKEIRTFGVPWKQFVKKEDRIRGLNLANKYGLLKEYTSNLQFHEKIIFNDILETLGQGRVIPSIMPESEQKEYFSHMRDMAEYRKNVIEFAEAVNGVGGLRDVLKQEYQLKIPSHRTPYLEDYEQWLDSDENLRSLHEKVTGAKNRMVELLLSNNIPFRGATVSSLQRRLIRFIENSGADLDLNQAFEFYRNRKDKIFTVYEIDPKEDARAVMLLEHPKNRLNSVRSSDTNKNLNLSKSDIGFGLEDILTLCDCEDAQYRGKVRIRFSNFSESDAYRECYHGVMARSLAVHSGGIQSVPRPTPLIQELVTKLINNTYHRNEPLPFDDISKSSRLTVSELDAYMGAAIKKFGFEKSFQYDESVIAPELLVKHKSALENIPVATTIILSRIQEAMDYYVQAEKEQKKWEDRIRFIETNYGEIEELPRMFILEAKDQFQAEIFQPYVTSEDDKNLRLIKKKWVRTNWPKYINLLKQQKEIANDAIVFLESKLDTFSLEHLVMTSPATQTSASSQDNKKDFLFDF